MSYKIWAKWCGVTNGKWIFFDKSQKDSTIKKFDFKEFIRTKTMRQRAKLRKRVQTILINKERFSKELHCLDYSETEVHSWVQIKLKKFKSFFFISINSCTASWHERVKRVQNADNGRNQHTGLEIVLKPPLQIKTIFWSEILPEVDRKWKYLNILPIIFSPLPVDRIRLTA